MAATRAPSVHNSQPWRWRYDGRHLDLHADWSRQLRRGDPAGRDLEISCGAALHHVVMAAVAAGWGTHVIRMPDRLDDTHLAHLSFHPERPGVMAQLLHEAIFARHTDRRSPGPEPVSQKHLETLASAGGHEGAKVTVLRTQEARLLLRDLRQLSVILQHDDEGYLEEFRRWTHSNRRDGVPDSSVLSARRARGRFDLGTRFPVGTLRDASDPTGPGAPSWLVVSTTSDDTLSHLRAGEALSAMLLKATLLDLAVVPYTQTLEVEVTRERVAERLLHGRGCPQLVLRVATRPTDRPLIPMTRRRALQDVLRLTGGPSAD